MDLAIIAFFIVLEFFLPREPIKFLKRGFWLELLWYFIAQGVLLQILVFSYLNKFYSAHSLHLVTNLPVWLQCIVLIVGLDFFDYWMHRLSHNWFPLWRTHEVHHTATELNWLSGSRIHVLELVTVRVIGGALLAALGPADTAVYVFGIVDSFMGLFTHSNLRINIGYLKYIINSPEMHRVHHLASKEHQFSNFANKFAMWDWLFGTARLPQTNEIERIGYGIGYHYPQSLWGQLIHLFRKKEEETPGTNKQIENKGS